MFAHFYASVKFAHKESERESELFREEETSGKKRHYCLAGVGITFMGIQW